MRQSQIFLETEDYRVITMKARDGSGKTTALVQQRDPATDTWSDVRGDTRGVFVHVSPSGIEIHFDKGAPIMLTRGHCNTCGEAYPSDREFSSAIESVQASAKAHASFHPGHAVSIETWDAGGERRAVTFRAPAGAAIPPPKV